jgi:hypothetical protein
MAQADRLINMDFETVNFILFSFLHPLSAEKMNECIILLVGVVVVGCVENVDKS